MTIGTKSYLFGLHQFILHPVLMLVAFIKIFKRLPNIWEALAIAIHDIGYIGKRDMDGQEGFYHPYRGAMVLRVIASAVGYIHGGRSMSAYYGAYVFWLCIGHNDEAREAEGLDRSPIYTVDKYYYVLIPVSMHRFLGELSGEHREIAESVGWDPAHYKAIMIRRFATGQIALSA